MKSASPVTPALAAAAFWPPPWARNWRGADMKSIFSATNARSACQKCGAAPFRSGRHQRISTVQVSGLHAAAFGENGRSEPRPRTGCPSRPLCSAARDGGNPRAGDAAARTTATRVTTLHGTDTTLLGDDPGYGPAIHHALTCSDAVTAVSEYLKTETRRVLEFNGPLEVIHNFFSRARRAVPREVRREFGVADNEVMIIHSSNLRPVKRFDLLLESCARPPARPSSWLCWRAEVSSRSLRTCSGWV